MGETIQELIQRRERKTKDLNKRFMSDTKSNEILIIILKAHLYIERELANMLTETVIDYKVISTATFRQKLDLANSMGLVEGLYGPVGKVNSIRNGYAHSIDYAFEEKDFEDLLSTLTKDDRDDYVNEYEKWKAMLYDGSFSEFNFKTQLLLSNIWFSMSSCRLKAKDFLMIRLKEKELETLSAYSNSKLNNV